LIHWPLTGEVAIALHVQKHVRMQLRRLLVA